MVSSFEDCVLRADEQLDVLSLAGSCGDLLSRGARFTGPGRVRGASRYELALGGGARKAVAAYDHRMGLRPVSRGLRGGRQEGGGSPAALPGVWGWMMFWSGYGRWVRAGPVFWIWVRRARCRACGGSSHALLPSFCLLGRLDAVEVIGPAVEAVADGAGTRSVARGMGIAFAYTTVRGWWRRHRQRVGLVEVVAGLGVSLPRLSAAVADEADGVRALKTVGVSVSAAVGIGVWPAVSLLSGGAWLSTTTNTPTTGGSRRRLMTVMAGRDSTIPP
jgi:hypothetical protein